MKTSTPALFKRTATILFVAAVWLTAAARLHAQTAVSNLGQPPRGSYGYIGNSAGSGVQQSVWTFTTGASAASFDFTGITVPFFTSNETPTNLTVGLYGAFDANTVAGTSNLLTNLNVTSGDPRVTGNTTLTGSTVSLAAGTTYYLAFSAPGEPSGSTYNFTLANSINEDGGGLPGWAIGNTYAISNGVSTWTTYDRVAMFSVQATAVPEPSTYAMLAGLGVLGFAAWRRRQKASAVATSGDSSLNP